MKNLKNNSISLLCLVAFLTLALPAHAGGTNEKPTTYAIGDTGPAGGIVFYITDGGLHGMEATPDDQHEGIGLCFSGVIPGADGRRLVRDGKIRKTCLMIVKRDRLRRASQLTTRVQTGILWVNGSYRQKMR
jgi:hypothetical protein